MIFQLNFPGLYHSIRIHIGNALVVCDLYGLYLHSGDFSALNGEAILSYFGLKNPLFTFCEGHFSVVKLLNH